MSDIAIKVENLSKRYRIGLKEEMHDTLVGALTDLVTRPVRNLRRLRRLTVFDDGRPETGDGNPVPSSPFSVPGLPSGEADIIWALKDVSFEVKRGEVVGIIGRNGAGKSTLLKILSHITYPTSGRVELYGRVSSLLEVGTGFHSELTGRENIYLNGTILGMTKAEIDKKFDEIVDFSGVEKFIDTPVKRYSSGMRVRLAFSVAAHLEPEILLIDEVLAVGDADFQKKCLGKMGEVAREGRTVLFVSHNMGAIRNLCPRTMVLDEGSIIIEGDTENAIDSYLTRISTSGTANNRFRSYHETGLGFFDVWFENSSGRTTSVVCGESISVCLGYQIKERTRVEWGLTFYNSLNEPVVHFGSQYSLRERLSLSLRGVIVCEIPHLPLPAGRYRLNVALYEEKRTIDHVIGAAFLDVHLGDYYGTGRTPPAAASKVLVDHVWRIR